MTHLDLLQEALTRLEAGESVETASASLPAEEAELLRTAAAMRTTPLPAREAMVVKLQRAKLLTAARTVKPLPPSRPAWVLPIAISGVFATVVLMALVSVTALGALWWWSTRGNNPVVQVPTAIATVAVDPLTPQTAALNEAKGFVEVQAADGVWKLASAGEAIVAGQRVRTGALSSVTLDFYDGSRARLGPNSELAVEALDAQTSGARVIQLTQISGDSDHEVAKSADPNSVYEVNTPSGAGRAKGTQFHVSVTAIAIHFEVSEGAVDVSNLNVTVIVIAGHSTVIVIGQPPAPPAPRISGEGEAQEITASAWRIAGQTLLVNASTLILGEPQVGDRVLFEGRLLADGTKVADRITLLSRRITNTFQFIGTVEASGAEAWTISGRTVRVNAETFIQAGIAVSDTVEASGNIAADGTLIATRIERLESATEPFTLTGVVQSIGEAVWTVSGITFTVTPSTTIEAGIVVSDVVRVQGVVLSDGTRQASSIAEVDDGIVGEFEFTGIVISAEPWNVSGVPLATDDETEIDEGIRVGNRVRVEGRILADGTYLATEIEQLDNGARHAIQFTARVQSIDPWVVGGVTVTVDSQTKIEGEIALGDLVTVKGNLLPDGTVLAKKITRVSTGQGCVAVTLTVIAINGNTLTLSDGQTLTLDGSIPVTGQLSVASIIIVQTCTSDDGAVTIIAIIVIFQLEPTPTPTLGPTPTPGLTLTPAPTPDNGFVTICHKPDKKGGKTMTIPASALNGHLGHGDTLGPCEGGNGGGDDDDDHDDDDD
jgi:hypothetical protein